MGSTAGFALGYLQWYTGCVFRVKQERTVYNSKWRKPGFCGS